MFNVNNLSYKVRQSIMISMSGNKITVNINCPPGVTINLNVKHYHWPRGFIDSADYIDCSQCEESYLKKETTKHKRSARHMRYYYGFDD